MKSAECPRFSTQNFHRGYSFLLVPVEPDGRIASRKPRYSLIIPAHNEASRIGAVLADYLDEFSDSEVIIVLNGCTDQTESVAYVAAGGRPNLRLLHIDHAVGKGGAVRAGFLAAHADIIGYVDADGATAPAEIRRLFELLGPKVDAVIGSRWSKGADVSIAQPFLRRLTSRIFNAVVRLLFDLPFSDTQCGAKVFRAEAIRHVADSLEISNFAFDIDLLYALRRTGRRIVEVPTRWRDVSDSKINNIAHASRAMLTAVARLRIRYSLFRYVIPIFDRMFPTSPLRVRNGFSILILNWRDPTHPSAGGAEKYLLEVARGLLARGHKVHWLTAGYPGSAKHAKIDGIEITRVGNRFTVYALVPLAYLRSFRDRFDIIVDAENGIPFFSPLYSLKPKLCLMFHVHQAVFDKHLPVPISTFFKWIEAKVMPYVYRSARFVAISGDTKSDLAALGVEVDRIDLAISGIDRNLGPSEKAKQPTILSLGRLKPYKRVDRLIGMMPQVLDEIPDARLVIAGIGEERSKLERLAHDLGVAKAVRFEGFVDEARKRELFAEAWVFGMTSEMEGWGLTIVEAGACGTPSVGFRVPGVREVIVDDVSGTLVDGESQFAAATIRILADSEHRTRLESGALRRSRDFSWEATTEAFVNVIVSEMAHSHTNYIQAGESWAVVPHKRMRSTTSMIRHEFELSEL